MNLTEIQRQAIRLAAARLEIIAHCEDHQRRQKDCPFCTDRAAYQGLVRAFPFAKVRDPFKGAKTISIYELRDQSTSVD